MEGAEWIEHLKQLETARDWPISWEKRMNNQISVTGFRSIKHSTIEPVCTDGNVTFSVFLNDTAEELPLKLNFSSVNFESENKASPVAVSVSKLHQLRFTPSEFQEDINTALNVPSTTLTKSGTIYMLTCMPSWFTLEQSACIFRHPLVIDVEITAGAIFIQFVRQTDATSSLRVIKQRRPELFQPTKSEAKIMKKKKKKSRSIRRNKNFGRAQSTLS